ncbi:MAG: carbohydrate ABC transporter permease [Chthoniobacterales bacterium]
MSRSHPSPSATSTFLGYFVLLLISVIFLLPLGWMLVTALKDPSEIFSRAWPEDFKWGNFSSVFQQPTLPFGLFIWNSIVIAGGCTILSLVVSSVTAFAFARLHFPGRDILFIGVLSTMMVPAIVTMIPSFVLFAHLGWIDTFLPFFAPALAGSAFQIFFLRQSFLSMPNELLEAARIDGCSNFRICVQIFIPLAKPTLATLGVLTFLGYWNDFMGPLVYLHSNENKTLPVGLMSFSGMFGTQWELLMAASLIALLPVLVLFMLCQRYFERGLNMGAVKG